MSIPRRIVCCKSVGMQRNCPYTQPRGKYVKQLLLCSWLGHRWDHDSEWWRMCGRCYYDETTED
jgi:hypothetical protein